MRIYSDCRELMSEMGRDLWEMGKIVKPKTYQNKVIEGNDDFATKELICEQYCLTSLDEEEYLFAYTNSKEWAEAEFAERINPNPINPGYAYLKRPEMWQQFLVNGIFDYSYGERMNQEVSYQKENMRILEAVAKQLANDPDTRKAILPIFGSYVREGYTDMGEHVLTEFERDIDRLDGHARIPCSMYYDFLIRDGKLNICYHERSSDFVQHFGNDVWLAWKLMEHMVTLVNQNLPEEGDMVEPGYLFHTIDSFHAYKKDWVKLKSNIDDYISK